MLTHKIAIIKGRNTYYGDYDEYNRRIVESITEWTEVSDEDFRILSRATSENDFSIIELMPNQQEFITKTVKEYLEIIKERQAKYDREEKARKEKAAKRKEEKDRKLYEKLKAKIESENSL